MIVKSEVQIYKKDGKGVPAVSVGQYITIESGSTYSETVVLHVNGVRYEVSASDLQKAVTNAQNC